MVKNKGAAGVDGIAIPEFKAHLQKHWPAIKGHLMAGAYVPNAVRRVDIPKPQGGTRMLGIPTLTDRLIQQALHQVLSPLFEPTFSDSSYGFRPGTSAHQAVKAAQRYITEGRRIVVDLDLSTSCGWKPSRHCQSSTSGFEGSFDASSGGNGKGLLPGTRI